MFEFKIPDKLKEQQKQLLDKISEFDNEEAELTVALNLLREKKLKEKLELDAINKQLQEREPCTIKVNYIRGAHAIFSIVPFRVPVKVIVNEFNNDRDDRYEGAQSLETFIWPEFVQMVKKNPKLSDTKWDYDPKLDEPYWKIKEHKKQLVVQWNPYINDMGNQRMLRSAAEFRNSLPNIPGADRNLTLKAYTIPLSEGWRLYEIHPELVSRLCEWESVELLEKVEKEYKKRLRMKEIHTAEDSLFDVIFPGRPDFKLRGHQKVAIEFSDLTDGMSLIAYVMGMGKTAIAIGDIIRRGTQRNVIAVPGKLRLNWAYHIEDLTGERPIILSGRVPTESDIKFLLVDRPKWVIINYDILRTVVKVDKKIPGIKATEDAYPWVQLLNMYNPDYVALDECHYTRNEDSNQSRAIRQLKGKNKMALSGTPIMNRPGELWPILNWLYPDVFPYYETFLKQYGDGRSITPDDASKLRSLLETIMIRRTRRDVDKDLPPINRIINTYEMSDKARKIYERILLGLYERMKEMDHLGRTELREANNILSKLNYMIQVCAVDKIDNTVEAAMELADSLEDSDHSKVLIFTHFKGTCCTIAQKLGHEALSFVNRTPNGFKTANVEERTRLKDQFQTDPTIRFLVVTDGTASEGIDLTAAGAVIFNDLFWTPSTHRQCESRAFEREIDLHVGDAYYHMFKDTIEDWILELQGIKDNTIDQVVEGKGVNYSVQNAILERVRALFEKRSKAA